ncbi:hypothetical protein V5P93_005875 [Actinokineospora auranticolor]|uniref:PASTA domain-containing protein n=1 Tax=Actinokineospora auranticolor TaxID=155976 RepID=A0A2S6GHN2_9PSEU|nr:hypothetical protein [Actinokineospora auranticolor]PPK64738.1 hypothetical protein CLV40_118128 [Actinokineospora auranticolor]
MRRVLLAALLLLIPLPAAADPTGPPVYRELAGTGDGSTAGLFNAIAETTTRRGVKLIGSYDTTGSPTITTKPNCTVPRSYTVHESVAAKDGCLQFARTSEFDSHGTDGLNIFIGYGVVTYAVSHDSPTSRILHSQYLAPRYRCEITSPIKPLLPRYGSSVRTNFLHTLWIEDSPTLTTRYPCIKDTDDDGRPLEENDPSALNDPDKLIPFSVPVYLTRTPTGVDLGRIDEVPIVRVDPSVPTDTIGYVTKQSSPISQDLDDVTLRSVYTCERNTYTPLLPHYGALVRSAFLRRIGIQDNADLTTRYPCLRDDIEAYDAAPVTRDTDILPFDVQTYSDQLNTIYDDTRAGTRISRVNGIPPITGKLGPGQHLVFVVVPRALERNSTVVSTFIGPQSAACRNVALIRAQGFIDSPGCGRAEVGGLNPRGDLPSG